MSITNELVAHYTTLKQLYTQSENDPKAFDEFTRRLIVHHSMEEKYFYDILTTTKLNCITPNHSPSEFLSPQQ